MTKKIKDRVVRLVEIKNSTFDVSSSSLNADYIQQSLFPNKKSNLILFIDMAKITESSFSDYIYNLKPLIVIDVRNVPRFDFGKLTRKKAFELFKKNNVHYFDVPRLFKADDLEATNESFSYFKKNVDFIINKLGKISGPILIFTQNYQKDAGYLKFLPKLLPLPDKQKWEVYSS